MEKGLANLEKHVRNIKVVYGLPVTVAINRFPSDTGKELDLVFDKCRQLGVPAAVSEVFAKGGEGGLNLAQNVLKCIEQDESRFNYVYPLEMSIKDKISEIAAKIYGAEGVVYTKDAGNQIANIESLGYQNLPVCMAKTQYSLSDDPMLLGRPEGFKITVRQVRLSAGAGFVVAILGEIMTLPGLPKIPSAEKIDVDANGRVSGLF